jgi:hypothetical protein
MVAFKQLEMPDKPTWSGQLEEIAEQLRRLPDRWIDRATLEETLRVGRRRAQQILAPCIERQIGPNGLADRETVIAHLRRLTAGDTASYEHQRRRRLAERLEALHRERLAAVMIEAPATITTQEMQNLPEGVAVGPGEISVRFRTTQEALEKLLALAMAIGNDPLLFERLAMGYK